jgi:hypothetical protein
LATAQAPPPVLARLRPEWDRCSLELLHKDPAWTQGLVKLPVRLSGLEPELEPLLVLE